jgi:hypothetical protein
MKKLVLVETISQHRVRFVVEVEDDINHALDEVVWREEDVDFEEFSQQHLGYLICSHREISEEESILRNKYRDNWIEPKKLSDDDFYNMINNG